MNLVFLSFADFTNATDAILAVQRFHGSAIK
jgi:hypothetical protein